MCQSEALIPGQGMLPPSQCRIVVVPVSDDSGDAMFDEDDGLPAAAASSSGTQRPVSDATGKMFVIQGLSVGDM